jgi:hypothetical protein
MSTIKAQVIEKNGKKEFAVISYADFLKLREELDDYEDLRCLREARDSEKDAPTIGLAELKRNLRARRRRSGGRSKSQY